MLDRTNTPARLMVMAALVFAVLIPQLLHPLGMGVDYFNHLARIYIQANIDTDPIIAQSYQVTNAFVPDLAMDLLITWFPGRDTVYMTGWLFTLTTLAMLMGGALVISRHIKGYWSFMPFFAAPVLYGEAMEWGFMNFLFSQGLALFAFYLWIASEKWPLLKRLAVFFLINIALFYSHILGFLVFGFLFGLYELGRYLDGERGKPLNFISDIGIKATQFVIPLLLFRGSQEGFTPTFSGVHWENLLLNWISPFGFVTPSQAIMCVAITLIIFLLLRRRLDFNLDRRLRVPVIGMALLVMFIPHFVAGIWGFHIRFAPVLFLLLAAGLTVKHKQGKPLKRYAEGLALLIVLFLGAVTAEIRYLDIMHHRAIPVLKEMDEGSSVFTAGDMGVNGREFWHISGIAVIEKSAVVPILFFGTSRVRPKPEVNDSIFSHALTPVPFDKLFIGECIEKPVVEGPYNPQQYFGWSRRFDYLFWIDGAPLDVDHGWLQLVASDAPFYLYKIIPPGFDCGAVP